MGVKMNFSLIVKKALYYISVPKCVCCGEMLRFGDRGLCKECLAKYYEHKKRDCSRCAKVLCECSCPSFFLKSHGIGKMIKLSRYSKAELSMPSNYLIYSLKQDNRSDVISFLTDEMVSALKNNVDFSKGNYIVTNVPRRKASVLNFGFDHAEQLARSIAKKLDIEYKQFLVAKAKNAQKTVQGAERIANAKFGYKQKPGEELKGTTVIIVDDIVTTGASMAGCASLIKALGVRKIIGAAVAIAYKDSYTPFVRF